MERRRQAAAPGLVAVLAALLALLAMHVLAGGHHAGLPASPRSAPSTEAAGPAAGHGHAPDRAGLARRAPAVPAASDAALLVTPEHSSAEHSSADACPTCVEAGVAAGCLAVLALAVVGLRALRPTSARRSTRTALRAPPARRVGPRPDLTPPDLVAELCVSRT